MKIAFMFSPQGAQYAGMGKDLYTASEIVKKRIDQANALLDYDLKDVLFNNEALLKQTRYVQPALFTLSVAIKDLMNSKGVYSSGSVGLSLGEYGAIYDRGGFSFETGITLIETRAKAMEDATQQTSGSMAAVSASLETIHPLVDQIDDLYIANYNLENQYVISGSIDAVEAFKTHAKAHGIRRVRLLNTAGAFHSPLMNQAISPFEAVINDLTLNEPSNGLYLNTTGNRYVSNLKSHMIKQITSPVKFYPAIQAMIADGYDTFIELGVKNTLASMVKKIDKSVHTYHVEDCTTLENVLKELK